MLHYYYNTYETTMTSMMNKKKHKIGENSVVMELWLSLMLESYPKIEKVTSYYHIICDMLSLLLMKPVTKLTIPRQTPWRNSTYFHLHVMAWNLHVFFYISHGELKTFKATHVHTSMPWCWGLRKLKLFFKKYFTYHIESFDMWI